MKKEQKHVVEQDYFKNTLSIDGDIYITDKIVKKKVDGVNHIEKVIYKKATQKEIDDSINKVVQAIKSKTNIDEVLRELIKDNIPNVKLKLVVKEIEKGKEVKKYDGCMGFKIGSRYIQLIG